MASRRKPQPIGKKLMGLRKKKKLMLFSDKLVKSLKELLM